MVAPVVIVVAVENVIVVVVFEVVAVIADASFKNRFDNKTQP